MKEIDFINKLKELHDFLSSCSTFVIDGGEYVLIDVLGTAPRSNFLFERKGAGYKITVSLFDMYESVIKGTILPKEKFQRSHLAQLLLSYKYLQKSQERKIRSWC